MRSIDLLGLAASIAAVSASPGNTSPSTALFSHNVLPECTAGGSLLITHGMHTALESYCSTAANTVIHGPNHINSTLAVDDAPMAVTIEVCDPVDFTVDSLFCFTQFASIVSGCPKTKSGTMTFSDPTVKLSLTANPTDGQQPLPILEEQNLAAVAARTTNTLPDGMSCLYEGTPVDSYGVITNVTEWCKVVDEVAIRPNGTTNRREQDHAGTIWYPEILNLQLHEYHVINGDLCTELFAAIVMSCQVDGKFYAGRWFPAPGPWIEHSIGVVGNGVPPAKWAGSSSKGKRQSTAVGLAERAEPTCSGSSATGAAKSALDDGVAAACANVAFVSQQLPASGWSWTYFEPYDGGEITYSWTSTGPFIQDIDLSTCESNLKGIIGACGSAGRGRWTDYLIGLTYEYDVNIFTKQTVDLALNKAAANSGTSDGLSCFPASGDKATVESLTPIVSDFCIHQVNGYVHPGYPVAMNYTLFDTSGIFADVQTAVEAIGSQTIHVETDTCVADMTWIINNCQPGSNVKRGGILVWGGATMEVSFTVTAPQMKVRRGDEEAPANDVIVSHDSNNPACFPVTNPVSQSDLLPLMQSFCDNYFNSPVPPYTNIDDTLTAASEPVYMSVYNIGSNAISVDPGWCYNNFATILADCQEGSDAKQGGVWGDQKQRLEYTLYVNVPMPGKELRARAALMEARETLERAGGPSMAARRIEKTAGGPSMAARRTKKTAGGPSMAAREIGKTAGGPSMAARRIAKTAGGPSMAARGTEKTAGGPSMAARGFVA